MKFNIIYLNDRRYKIYDIGEGQSVMFIFHREKSMSDLEDIVRLKLKSINEWSLSISVMISLVIFQKWLMKIAKHWLKIFTYLPISTGLTT